MPKQTKYHTILLSEMPVLEDPRNGIIGTPVDSVEMAVQLILKGVHVSASAEICAETLEILRATP